MTHPSTLMAASPSPGQRRGRGIMSAKAKKLLSQVRIGLEAIADACDRLPDIELAAHACHVADQLQAAVEAVLQGSPTEEDGVCLREAIAELQALLIEEPPRYEVDPREESIRQLARERWAEEGRLEIESDADVAEYGDNGAMVSAWVWVSFEGTPLDTRRK